MLFKVTSHLQRSKESFIWQKSQTIYLRFPKKIKIFKIVRFILIELISIKKLRNAEGVIISQMAESPW